MCGARGGGGIPVRSINIGGGATQHSRRIGTQRGGGYAGEKVHQGPAWLPYLCDTRSFSLASGV